MLEDRAYMRNNPYQPQRSATFILIMINIAVFVVQSLAEAYTSLPVEKYFYLSPNGLKSGFIWQFFTFQFLHGGPLHLLFNCLVIWFFGREVEEALGQKTFWKLYLICGVAGGVLQVLFQVVLAFATNSSGLFQGEVIGASAGGLGLIAAFATLFPERVITLLLFFILPVSLRAKTLLWISFGLALFGMMIPKDDIAHAAHLGGIIAGILFIKQISHGGLWSFSKLMPRRSRPRSTMGEVSVHRPKRPANVEPEDFIRNEVDPILDKISAHGIHSLTAREREILDRARKQMGQR